MLIGTNRFGGPQRGLAARSAWLGLAIMVMVPSFAGADLNADLQTIERLVAAGKFDEAEWTCREQLSDSNLPMADRNALTVALLDTLTIRAAGETGEVLATRLAAAEKVANDYLRFDGSSLLRFLVEFRAAGLPRLAAKARPAGISTEDDSLRNLRDSIRRLERLGDALDQELREHRRHDPNEAGYLTDRELRNLRDRVGLELGCTFLAQAELYDDRSEDRVLAAGRAAVEFERLSPTALSRELWFESRLKLIASLRLKSDWPACAQQLRPLQAMRLSPSERTAIANERIRIAIARNDWDRLTQLVAQQTTDAPLGEDGSLAAIEAYMALADEARQSAEEQQATDWERRAGQLIEKASGEYEYSQQWLSQAQRLLASHGAEATAETAEQGVETTFYLHAAEGLLRQHQWQAAKLAYEKAANAARDRGETERLLRAAKAVAGVELKQGEVAAAAEHLRRLALEIPTHPEAPAIHLMALKLKAGQVTLSDPTRSADEVEPYARLLREHLTRWPSSPFASQVHLWLGRYLQQEGDHLHAVGELREVGTDKAARLAAAINDERISLLELLADDPSPATLNELDQSAARWRGIAESTDISVEARQAAGVALVDVLLRLDRDIRVACRVLSATNAIAPRAEVQRALMACYFRQADWVQASQYLRQCDDSDLECWIECFELLSRLPTDRAAAHWRLQALREIGDRKQAFSPPQATRWRRLQAEALADAGDLTQAAEVYAKLKTADPRNGDLAVSYARTVSEDKTRSCENKLQAWREVLVAAPVDSDWWWEAKYGVASALAECGKPRRATDDRIDAHDRGRMGAIGMVSTS